MANEKLRGLIADVNPREIAQHIEAGNLHVWCDAWRDVASSCLPSCDAVEVVHAYWIGDEPGDWHCSHCGEYAADGGFEQTRYCPHCGSLMDGERRKDA